jgi:hypothetical protein
VSAYLRPPATRTSTVEVGWLGVTVAAAGAVLVLTGSFAAWYSAGGRSVYLHDLVSAARPATARFVPHAYFGGVFWLLLAATIAISLLANLPGRFSRWLSLLSPLLGVLGVLVTYAGLEQLVAGGRVFEDSALGLWLVLGGWLVTGIGGAAGPRPR